MNKNQELENRIKYLKAKKKDYTKKINKLKKEKQTTKEKAQIIMCNFQIEFYELFILWLEEDIEETENEKIPEHNNA